MRALPVRLLLLLAFVAVPLPAGAAQESPKPPANDDCLACHGDKDLKRSAGSPVFVSLGDFTASKHGPMACVDCHADLATVKEFPHADKLAKVNCASCHDDVGTKYHDSIHAKGREKSGLVVAPSCADCHGTHDIKGKLDGSSRVFRTHVSTTCGRCHEGIKDKYDHSIHAVAFKKASNLAPVCIDCHTAHAIQRVETESWRLAVAAECGTCHAKVVDSFRRTFHGKVTQLGFTRVAACADCHGAHDILPASNPASTVSPGRLVETCRKCHPGANERFVRYDPHPDPHNYARGAALWWANAFYWTLIPGCFGFFGLHSVWWFWRSRREGSKETR